MSASMRRMSAMTASIAALPFSGSSAQSCTYTRVPMIASVRSIQAAWAKCGAALASAAPHFAQAAWMERTEAIMGTRVYVQLWADDPEKGNAAMDAVMADMRRIDALMKIGRASW